MLDIVQLTDGADMGVQNSSAPRAANIASTQMGEKNFLPATFGVDLKFFLTSDFEFQMLSFKSYIVQRLIEHKVNVGEVISTLEPFIENIKFEVGDPDTSKGLI